MTVDTIITGNCLDVMRSLPDGCIDLTVTSPPYDNLRKYNGYTFDFEGIARELFRVTKKGGVVVWVVGDATINGSESGTSFRQALYFKEIGFNLETMIYRKGGQGATGSNSLYWQDFEFMFILSKGLISTFNPLLDRKNASNPSRKQEQQGHRNQDGSKKGDRIITRQEYGKRYNVWEYHECGTQTDHPAPFPEKLARDHILSWSNEGDLVFDPMCGSGTTLKMAAVYKRHYLGCDISEEYCNIARKRVEAAVQQLTLL